MNREEGRVTFKVATFEVLVRRENISCSVVSNSLRPNGACQALLSAGFPRSRLLEWVAISFYSFFLASFQKQSEITFHNINHRKSGYV